jgi:hypothetical protein
MSLCRLRFQVYFCMGSSNLASILRYDLSLWRYRLICTQTTPIKISIFFPICYVIMYTMLSSLFLQMGSSNLASILRYELPLWRYRLIFNLITPQDRFSSLQVTGFLSFPPEPAEPEVQYFACMCIPVGPTNRTSSSHLGQRTKFSLEKYELREFLCQL